MSNAIKPGVPSRDFFSVDEIGRIPEGLFGSAAAGERLRMLSLQNAWSRAVGEHLKVVTRPARLRGARLVVEVRDQAWKREVDRLKPEILSRLALLLPTHPIAEILFRVPDQAAARPAATAAQAGAAGARAIAPVRRPAPNSAAAPDGVAEPDLRERLSGVMGRYLARAR